MNLNKGDFVFSPDSNKPSLIIEKEEDSYLVTIDEYNGDYKWVKKYRCDSVILNPEYELSILSNYGNWFYKQHEDIFQEIIIKNLHYYFKN